MSPRSFIGIRPMRVMPEFGSRPKRYGANRPTGITGLGSQHVPRFLCDEMLHGLGRWLRAARPGTRHGLCRRAPGFADQGPASRRDRAGIASVVLVQGNGIDETARPCAPLLISTGSTRRSAAVWSTTGRLSRRRLTWRRRCRKGHAPLAAHCGCAPNAAASTGRVTMFVECSSGLLRGNGRRPRPVKRSV